MMLGWILGKVKDPQPKKWYEDLPEGCKYDPESGSVIVTHRNVRGYFNEKLVKEMREAGIDYIDDFRKSVDEVLDEEDVE